MNSLQSPSQAPAHPLAPHVSPRARTPRLCRTLTPAHSLRCKVNESSADDPGIFFLSLSEEAGRCKIPLWLSICDRRVCCCAPWEEGKRSVFLWIIPELRSKNNQSRICFLTITLLLCFWFIELKGRSCENGGELYAVMYWTNSLLMQFFLTTW
jgi:hypothetical protein